MVAEDICKKLCSSSHTQPNHTMINPHRSSSSPTHSHVMCHRLHRLHRIYRACCSHNRRARIVPNDGAAVYIINTGNLRYNGTMCTKYAQSLPGRIHVFKLDPDTAGAAEA